MESCFLKRMSSFLARTYFITNWFEAFRHYIVELKKQVFPKFFSPWVHKINSRISSSLYYDYFFSSEFLALICIPEGLLILFRFEVLRADSWRGVTWVRWVPPAICLGVCWSFINLYCLSMSLSTWCASPLKNPWNISCTSWIKPSKSFFSFSCSASATYSTMCASSSSHL